MNNIEQIKEIERINKERNKQLKERFGRFMKGNLLIKIKEEIKSSPDFQPIIQNCYDLKPKFILASGIDDLDYDICLKLAMNYWYRTLTDNNEEKSVKNSNQEFINKLKSEVVLECSLRPLNNDIGNADFYTYHTSLNYSIHSATNYMLSFLFNIAKERFDFKNKDFKINTLVVMLKLVRSILLLIESDNMGSAYSLFRTLIETFCVYRAIDDNENVASTYYQFMNFRNEYDTTGTFPEEFKTLVSNNVSHWQNYLNYGWIDGLENLESLTQNKYVFKDLLKYMKKVDKEYLKDILIAYKFACKFSHGNYLNQSFDIQHCIWILGRVAVIILDIANEFKNLFKTNFIFKNIDLIKFLYENVKESSQIYLNLTQNQK